MPASSDHKSPPPTEDVDEEGFLKAGDWSHLRQNYKGKRELFCHEYIKDFNGSQALQRMGYVRKAPWVTASEWLGEPYTQWYLGTLIAKLDERAIVTKNQILMGLWKEANYHGLDGGAASRVAAFRALAKILGIEVTKVEGSLTLQGGVMTIPLSGTPEEWEKAAEVAQATLKKNVRT